MEIIFKFSEFWLPSFDIYFDIYFYYKVTLKKQLLIIHFGAFLFGGLRQI